MRDDLTFEDGILLCKHIYQSAIEKTLNGVMEQEQIFYRAHELLNKLEKDVDKGRLEELMHMLNIENIYATI
jgi:hypothetical protein